MWNYFYLLRSLCNSKKYKTLVLYYQWSKWHLEENNGNKYLILVPADERKGTLKNIKNYGIKSKTSLATSKNSDDYNKKYLKMKFNSDANLPLQKTLELCNMIIVVKSVFHEVNKDNSKYNYIVASSLKRMFV